MVFLGVATVAVWFGIINAAREIAFFFSEAEIAQDRVGIAKGHVLETAYQLRELLGLATKHPCDDVGIVR